MVSVAHEARGTTAHVIHDLLIKDFMSGSFLPGAKLRMDDLAERYSVSRTPIREALMLLTQDGVLANDGNYGFEVRIPSYTEICEMYDIRRALECLAVEKLVEAGVTPEVMQQLADNQAALEGTLVNKELTEIDQRFHELICDNCGAPSLSQLVRRYMVLSTIFNFVSFYMPTKTLSSAHAHKVVCSQHKRIIDGIAAGNAAKARKAMADHLRDARRFFEQVTKKLMS